MTSRWDRKRISGWAGAAATLTAAGLVASCGGGGGEASSPPIATGQAAIDSTGVTRAASDYSAFIPLCQGTAGGTAVDGKASPALARALGMLAQQRRAQAVAAPNMRAQAYTGSVPADSLGDCGGRLSYPSYSHSNGVTTAVMRFSDYCMASADTGYREVVNGELAFVNTATPTASGPITRQWEGSSSGLRVQVQKADGSSLSTQTVAFDKLIYTVGVPGGVPTAAQPDRLSAAEFTVANAGTGKTYRQTGYAVTLFDTADGGQQMAVSGRGYRADGSWFDISTPTPMRTDGDGDYLAGTIRFDGANGNHAVATLVPGSRLQATLTVNGAPMAGLPACSK